MSMTTETTCISLPAAPPVDDLVGWEPNRVVFCSIIFAELEGGARQQVTSTRWASLEEARGFIERRMPAVRQVRADHVRVTAYVVPAETHVRMRDGELVQDVVQNWQGAQQAVLNSRGFVTW